MRLSLAQQFVLATLTLTLAVLLATLLLARWSFERGFLEYVRELEYKRLEEVATELSSYYDPQTGWQGLSRRAFFAALRTRGPDVGRHPPREPRLDGSAPPPPRGPRPSAPGGRLPGGTMTRLPGALPTALFDADGALVMDVRFSRADIPSEVLSYEIVVDDAVVGELRSQLQRRLESAQETRFARRQRQASLLIFAVAMTLALVMAVLLSRRLLAPLRRAHAALGAMAGGDYDQRLETERHDELGELMNDIDLLARTLEENQDTRRRWIADISHELRTPVSILKGELEAMVDGVRPLDQQQLRSLRAEVERLAKLIEDLFQLSLADLGGLRYEFSRLDFAALVSRVCGDYERRFGEQGLRLVQDLPDAGELRGDARRLEQLLRNLLENSLAYTDSPGEVHVALRCDNGRARLLLRDSAPGVEAALCEKLFDPLYRHDSSRNRRSAGAGLGLAIVRAVVDAHDGQIRATPSDLGGLAIEVELPLQDKR